MKEEIKINGKNYTLKKIDFNALCELENLGLDINDLKGKTFNCIRTCFAYHSGLSIEEASREIEEHFKNKGKLDDLVPFIKSVVDSDFFQSLS